MDVVCEIVYAPLCVGPEHVGLVDCGVTGRVCGVMAMRERAVSPLVGHRVPIHPRRPRPPRRRVV